MIPKLMFLSPEKTGASFYPLVSFSFLKSDKLGQHGMGNENLLSYFSFLSFAPPPRFKR